MKGLVFFCIFVVGACALPPPPPPFVKPGRCPNYDVKAPCGCRMKYRQCYHDFQCSGAKKCCVWDCGCRSACVNPVKTPQTGCKYNGTFYKIGEGFIATDGCQWCTCTSSGIRCLATSCMPFECQYSGERYRAGEQFPAATGCGTCSCQIGGIVDCTDNCDDLPDDHI